MDLPALMELQLMLELLFVCEFVQTRKAPEAHAVLD